MADKQKKNDMKMEKVKQYGARVIIAQSVDVNLFLNILEQTDFAVMKLRKNMGRSVSVETSMDIIDKLETILLELQDITKQAMEATGSEYVKPRSIIEVEQAHAKNLNQ